MKRNYKIIIGFVVAIVLAISVIEAVGYIQSQAVHCSVDPYDTGCFCYETEVRSTTLIDGRVFATCNPTVPTNFEPPIETWEEAMEFVKYNFGTNECFGVDTLLESPYKPSEPFTEVGAIPEEFMDYLIELRCLKILDYYPDGNIRSFTVSWSIMFYPRSGNIWERVCNPVYIDTCPDDIRPFSILAIFM